LRVFALKGKPKEFSAVVAHVTQLAQTTKQAATD
jgi:hypothetical protein